MTASTTVPPLIPPDRADHVRTLRAQRAETPAAACGNSAGSSRRPRKTRNRKASNRKPRNRKASNRKARTARGHGEGRPAAASDPAAGTPRHGYVVSGTARTAHLPFDHLFAELAAFPLASESALAHPLTHLDPAMSAATRRLWRAAERELLAAAPGVSLDDLVALRDGSWFAEDDGSPRPLQAFLRHVALRHLEYLGAGVGPRRPPPLDGPIAARPAHAQARQSWLWLTFALPEDLLMAMAARDGWIPRPDLLTPAVRDLLARGFAETHLHVGASLDFRCVWSLLLARLASPGLRVAAARRARGRAAGGPGPAGLAAALCHRPDAARRVPRGHRGRLRRVRPGAAAARAGRGASRPGDVLVRASSPSPTWSAGPCRRTCRTPCSRMPMRR